MPVPETLSDWTLATVRELVDGRFHESDAYDFKEALNGNDKDQELNDSILRSACALANTRGGFLVFGVRDRGADRIVGIPESAENQKQLADKLRRAEPSLEFDVLNPQPLVSSERVLLIAEIRAARSGPISFLNRRDAREFPRRTQGTSVAMTYPEIRNAFTNYNERLARVHLVFMSLADNWARLKEMAAYDGFRGGIATQVPDMTQVRQHLVDVNELCPEAIVAIFNILQISDAITAAASSTMPALSLALTDLQPAILKHNRAMAAACQSALPHYQKVLGLFQEKFAFEPMTTTRGMIPPVQYP